MNENTLYRHKKLLFNFVHGSNNDKMWMTKDCKDFNAAYYNVQLCMGICSERAVCTVLFMKEKEPKGDK